MLSPQEIDQLRITASEARTHSFVHRTGFAVGATVLTLDGQYFGGCNIESIISGLGACAEVAAIDHAVVHGHYQFKALAVIGPRPIFPCGACLQYLSLFGQVSGQDVFIVALDDDSFETKLLSQLLPHRYLTANNLEAIEAYRQR